MRRALAILIFATMTTGPMFVLAHGDQQPIAPPGHALPGLSPEVLALIAHPAAWQDFQRLNEQNLLGSVLPAAQVPLPMLPSVGILQVMLSTSGDAAAPDPLVLAQYDAMPAASRAALGSLLVAYLDMAHATKVAFKGLSVADRDAFLADPKAPMPVAFDFALLLGGQRELLAAAQAAVPVFRADLPSLAQLPPLTQCNPIGNAQSILGGINIDFSVRDNAYACDFGFSIDGQGNDVYNNNAGGSGSKFLPMDTGVEQIDHFSLSGSGFGMDLMGDDQYLSYRAQGGIAGGAFVGSGMLIEVAGDDTYYPQVDSSGDLQGGSEEGAGVLLDLAGDDNYNGHIGLNRKFHSSGGGINGGTTAGSGLMVDMAGNDVYNGYENGAGGVNGGLHGGSAALIDYAGDDSYDGFALNTAGVNGGGIGGHGFLLDGAGNDVYNGWVDTVGGVNGGAWLGTGQLVDVSGDDRYDGSVETGGVNGGSFDPYSYGLLQDLGGDDHYTGEVRAIGGVNGAAFFGQAQLLDWGQGDDVYESRNALGSGSSARFANGAAFLSEGLLFDDGGVDMYRDHQEDSWQFDLSCYPKGSAVGAQFDAPHANDAERC
ncbi:MAG: hypothetical protein LC624_09460 [Halobacteriales archaeon]|nr:hypothetical protein [Halobacteriales archaeon]